MSERPTQPANGVRSRKLIPFPPRRPDAWPPHDQVVVHHAGEVRTYESPQALAAAVQMFDPVGRARLSQLRGQLAEVRALEREARELLYLARADRLRANLRDQLGGFLMGIAFTLAVASLLAKIAQ